MLTAYLLCAGSSPHWQQSVWQDGHHSKLTEYPLALAVSNRSCMLQWHYLPLNIYLEDFQNPKVKQIVKWSTCTLYPDSTINIFPVFYLPCSISQPLLRYILSPFPQSFETKLYVSWYFMCKYFYKPRLTIRLFCNHNIFNTIKTEFVLKISGWTNKCLYNPSPLPLN